MVFLLAPVVLYAGADKFSYVYIQGDKSIPFYVKLEDQMLPRYGKNYNLIPQLAPGPINIQILFQQNAYPAQKFTVMVPENGFRGFLLLRKGNSFSLYDIHQQFYLQPGNKAADDKAPAANTADAYVYTNQSAGQEVKTVKKTTGTTLKFLPNVELSNERTIQHDKPVASSSQSSYGDIPAGNSADNNVGSKETGNRLMVANSDCPHAIEDDDFQDLCDKARAKSEKVKLKFLISKMDACYTTNQARILADYLSNDPERYTFLKRVYPRVTDQYNFPMLENLLSTREWKSYFKLILPK